jgi:hypothetical protein
MALKRSRRGLQLWFRPCCNPILQSGVMAVQSFGSPVGTISGLHFGSPENLCHSDVASATSRKGEPFIGREATAPSIIRKIEKVQGGEEVPRSGSLIRDQPQKILYGGRCWLPPSPGRGESCVSKCPWQLPTPKGVPECELTTWVVCFDADSCLIY